MGIVAATAIDCITVFVLDKTICDKVCQGLNLHQVNGFSLGISNNSIHI